MKRKGNSLSPTVSPTLPDRAVKFQRGEQGDVGSSPALRIRRGLDTKPKSPPASGVLSSPAVGRVNKMKRRLITPRRSYTPDKKQALITSLFSPKVLPSNDNGKE